MQSVYGIYKAFWRFMAIYQPMFLRCLHILIALLIVAQIINSNGMAFSPTHQLESAALPRIFTLMHISIGLSLLALSIILIGYCFKRRGLRYFYPYLWGGNTQIKQDIHTLLRGKLPEVEPEGLATCVQGLGLGALSLVVLSGASWFVLWQLDLPFESTVKDWHKMLTGLIEVYIVAHGVMGGLHFALWYRQHRMH